MKGLFSLAAIALGFATLAPVSAHYCGDRACKWENCDRNNASCRKHFCNEYSGNPNDAALCSMPAYTDPPCWYGRKTHHRNHHKKVHKMDKAAMNKAPAAEVKKGAQM